MKSIISVMLIISGIVIAIYGWQMRSMIVSHEEIKTKTEIKEIREEKNTKLRNASIGAAIGAAALGATAVIVGGVGVVAMGTGIGIPAGAGLIAGATALGAAAGGVSGAATADQETIIKQVPYQVEYKVIITTPKYAILEYSLVLGSGIALIMFGGLTLRKQKSQQVAKADVEKHAA
jgi:hypothetical protein